MTLLKKKAHIYDQTKSKKLVAWIGDIFEFVDCKCLLENYCN